MCVAGLYRITRFSSDDSRWFGREQARTLVASPAGAGLLFALSGCVLSTPLGGLGGAQGEAVADDGSLGAITVRWSIPGDNILVVSGYHAVDWTITLVGVYGFDGCDETHSFAFNE